MKQKKIYIYGKNAIAEALISKPEAISKIYLSPQMEDKKLRGIIKGSGIPIELLDPGRATSQVEGGAAHQGVIGLISLPNMVTSFEKFSENLSPNPNMLFVFLDGVQDPHNLGAIIRSAAAFGASAVLMPQKNQSPITGAAIKSSAGMAFRVPLVTVENSQQAIAVLKKKGVRAYGLAGDGKTAIGTERFSPPALFLFGNEGEGLSPGVRILCDETLSIPMNPRCESLNVAASAAVAMYAWSSRHPRALN